MAKFEFVGLKDRPGLVKNMGVVTKIRLHQKDGARVELLPPNGEHWKVGDSLTVDDERAARHLDADPRFRRV